MPNDYVFNAKFLKPLAEVLRSALMALGHATSAHSRFVKIKSRNISPDGNLGGRGYIQKVPDMRRQLMNCIEVLSAMTDSVYDEINAPHWAQKEDILDPRDRDEVKEIVEDVENIKGDPEGWAEGEEEEMDEEQGDGKGSKTPKRASRVAVVSRYRTHPLLPRVISARGHLQAILAGDLDLIPVLQEETAHLIYAMDKKAGVVAWDPTPLRVSNLVQRYLASSESPNV